MHLFSVFLPIRIRSISDRYQDHRFPILGEIKRFFAKRRIEIANPTSPQALLCGCQTQMFHCNGDIHIAMILIVEILPTPGKRMVDTGQNHARRRANPIAIVTGVDFLQFVFLRNDMKTPFGHIPSHNPTSFFQAAGSARISARKNEPLSMPKNS